MTAATMDVALARNRDFAAARRHEGIGMFPITTFLITCIDPRVDPPVPSPTADQDLHHGAGPGAGRSPGAHRLPATKG